MPKDCETPSIKSYKCKKLEKKLMTNECKIFLNKFLFYVRI